ncbi:MAG TPA: adenosyl-hopene transferase HpnH [Candidatus Baltobacteraceae bacterium]|nr:adenosyl-hopene transferase HpnH [Candidatus Baltobacteraceae bacterium]
MRFPVQLQWTLTKYIAGNALRGKRRYPFVLMLEPTHLCNLACESCGKIREFESTIRDMLPVATCLQAVEDCGAPVVSICGGEPTIYPHLDELVTELLRRKKFIYLCTNGIKLEKFLRKWKPSPYLTINISMDGLESTHDLMRSRKGLYQMDIQAIKLAKSLGYRVVTNTTVYKETNVDEIAALFAELQAIGVDGFLVTPGYEYGMLKDRDIFLEKEQTYAKFQRIWELANQYRIYSTPLYLRFLKGERELTCSPWGGPNYNPQGWKGPCYLITDAHYPTFDALMTLTDWERFEQKRDPRCANCMMHSGFEHTVVREVGKRWRDLWEMLWWNLT